jgi:hypothetical protein
VSDDFEIAQFNTYDALKEIYDDARYLAAESRISMCAINDARTIEEIEELYKEFLKKLRRLNRISVDARTN